MYLGVKSASEIAMDFFQLSNVEKFGEQGFCVVIISKKVSMYGFRTKLVVVTCVADH